MNFIIKSRLLLTSALTLSSFVAISFFTVSFAEPPKVRNHGDLGIYFDPASKQYFTSEKPRFSIQPTGNDRFLEKIEVSVDEGSFSKYDGLLNFSKEGAHNIRFRAVDPVLNWSPIQSYRIYVDLTAPETFLTWEGPHFTKDSQTYIGKGATLDLTAHDNLSGISHLLMDHNDGKPFTRFSGKRVFTKEGLHSVKYAAVDNVGNQEPWQPLQFNLDSKAPTTEIQVHGMTYKLGATQYIRSGGQIVLTGVDDKSGIKRIEYQLGSGAIATYSQPISVTGKTISLKYRGIDQVGNLEDWKKINLSVDSLPPLVKLKEIGPFVAISGRIYARSGFKLKTYVEDTESGVGEILVSKNNGSFEPSKETEFTFTDPGEYQFNLQAKDRVGNLAEANPFTVVIDSAAPSSELTSTEPLVTRDGTHLSALPNRLKISGVDSGVGIDHIEVSYDGKVFKKISDTIDLATWDQPKKTVYYRAVDRLGNTEKAKSIIVHVLRKGPIVDLFVESENLPKVPLSTLLKNSKRIPANTSQEGASE